MSAGERRGRARTVTKATVVQEVRTQTGLTWEESAQHLETVLELMKEALENGESVKISGFGSFLVRHKAPRRGRNPQTAERIVISKRRVLAFKPSLGLRASLNVES